MHLMADQPQSDSTVFAARYYQFPLSAPPDKRADPVSPADSIHPDYGIHYNDRGMIYESIKEYDKAMSDFNKAVELGYLEAKSHRDLLRSSLRK